MIWLLISVHVWYLYISFSSDQVEDKWWTFIEATTDKTNYLPYTSSDDNDKFYQSLLFNWCVYPTIDGTTINYRDELCTVTTENYQRFEVTVKDDKIWSDGEPVTLNDVLFTYKTILKDNYWNISSLDAFRNVLVSANAEEWTLTVTFPNPSIDNMIFFTNFILPSHLLGNQPLENYVSTFYQDPVTSTCIMLQKNSRDATNTVFDLSNCSTTLLKYYQVKTFETQDESIEYVKSNPDTIDMIFSDVPFDGYTQNKVILNKFTTLFLNTKNPRMNKTLRKNIASLFNAIFDEETMKDWNDLMIRDRFLFDSIASSDNIEWLTSQELWSFNDAVEEVKKDEPEITELPEKLVRWGNNPEEQEYKLSTKITDKVPLQLSFSEAFDKLSVTVNEWVEYYPSTYNKASQSSLYNLNPLYRNIVQWRNLYTIKWYKGTTHTNTYRFIIYYLDEAPSYPAVETTTDSTTRDPIEIIYFTDPASQAVVDTLQTYFEAKDIVWYFDFQGFGDTNTFEGKITSQDYDVAIRSINMGLRKDISNLFTSSIPTINPSVYTNQELADAINRFFLVGDDQKPWIKNKIDAIYSQDIPLIVLWKELWTIAIRESLEFPYPQRLYVLWWRRDFIDTISIFDHISVNWEKVFNIWSFFSFLWQYF